MNGSVQASTMRPLESSSVSVRHRTSCRSCRSTCFPCSLRTIRRYRQRFVGSTVIELPDHSEVCRRVPPGAHPGGRRATRRNAYGLDPAGNREITTESIAADAITTACTQPPTATWSRDHMHPSRAFWSFSKMRRNDWGEAIEQRDTAHHSPAPSTRHCCHRARR